MINAMVVVKENISLFMSYIYINRKEGKNALLKIILKNKMKPHWHKSIISCL